MRLAAGEAMLDPPLRVEEELRSRLAAAAAWDESGAEALVAYLDLVHAVVRSALALVAEMRAAAGLPRQEPVAG